MHLIDWILLLLPLAVVIVIAVTTHRYMRSVADFVSGSRLAGPYLLAVAKGEMQAGAVVFVAAFEMIARAGFTMTWWRWIEFPVYLLVAITGFVVYRYRETRAMTLAQFFEMRYSRRYRLFTGALGFLSGVVNFGITPAIGARIFVYLLDLPESVGVFGAAIPTYLPLMALFLGTSLFLTLAGGLITLMVTDCVEGIMSQFLYLVIIAGLLYMFSWSQINDVLTSAAPGQSMMNPFDSQAAEDFNLSYVFMGLFLGVYSTMAWQNTSAYNSAAVTPHESRMSNILGRWRELGKFAIVALLTVCALTYLRHADFASQATAAHARLAGIAQPQLREQMQVPVALSHLLPAGVRGALCAVLLMGIFGGDSTHLHSWSGIFVQDVLLPLRKKPFTPAQHVRVLRWAAVGVAVFAFCFGALFRQTEYVLMWWVLTQAIYVGGAGAAIIGGLYWKKATTAGAWSALLTGSVLSGGGVLVRAIYGRAIPLNGMEISFYATLIAITVFVVVSLFTSKKDFDLDRMLHRGRYAAADTLPVRVPAEASRAHKRFSWQRLVGIDSEFSRGDRWITTSLFTWTFGWFGVMAVGCIWNFFSPLRLSFWSGFWHVAGITIPITLSVVTAIWFTWGGVRDIRELFARLKRNRVDHRDDGTVGGPDPERSPEVAPEISKAS